MGWAQFEHVCDEVLAAEGFRDLAWDGRADALRTASAGGRIVATAWTRFGVVPDVAPGSLVLTNDDESGLLAELVDRHPVVRRRVPSLLGVCDLDVPHGGWDVGAARELARVFVPTRAYRNALDVLERHDFTLLSGPPEMGKTAIARILGLVFAVEGWEVHECIRPEQLWDAFDRSKQQLFVADDAFGSTEYRPDAAERWALDLDRILRSLDDRHRLVWTSRPAPLKEGLARVHREHGVERFPRPAEVHVDAAALDVREKASILFRHVRAASAGPRAVRLVRAHGIEMVEHPHFTPERIKRFVARRLPRLKGRGLREAIRAEIAEPTAAMSASFAALSDEHRALLVGLVDAPPGPVSERDLAAAARRHAPDGLPRPPAELVDRLTDHFLRVVPPTSVTWVHPSWRDLVIDHLAADAAARRRFLARCSIDGALVALARAGGATGERARPLLVDDGDWDMLTDRVFELVPELADPDLARLFAVLDDGLRFEPRGSEFVPFAAAVLGAVSRSWDRRESFPSPQFLQRWRELSWLLEEPPEPPRAARMWVLPEAPPARSSVVSSHAEPLPSVDWHERERAAALVERILADLEAG